MRPIAGQLFVHRNEREDFACEWLIVRYHPDDHNLVLLVPVHTEPKFLADSTDVILDETRIAACNHSLWVPFQVCSMFGKLTDHITSEQLSEVRKRLHILATGKLDELPTPEDPNIFCDPNELHHDLEREVAFLEKEYSVSL